MIRMECLNHTFIPKTTTCTQVEDAASGKCIRKSSVDVVLYWAVNMGPNLRGRVPRNLEAWQGRSASDIVTKPLLSVRFLAIS